MTPQTYNAIKSEMKKLKEDRIKLLDSIPWALSAKGARNNQRLFKRAEDMQKKIMKLNKKLLNL